MIEVIHADILAIRSYDRLNRRIASLVVIIKI